MNQLLKRRRVKAWSAGLVAGAVVLSARSPNFAQQPIKIDPVTASQPTDQHGRQVSLYDQLRVGLKAKTDDDVAFLKLVTLRVNQGVLPRKMVDATFLWARNRYKLRPTNHQLRPIVYFKPGLQAQAKKIGVVL